MLHSIPSFLTNKYEQFSKLRCISFTLKEEKKITSLYSFNFPRRESANSCQFTYLSQSKHTPPPTNCFEQNILVRNLRILNSKVTEGIFEQQSQQFWHRSFRLKFTLQTIRVELIRFSAAWKKTRINIFIVILLLRRDNGKILFIRREPIASEKFIFFVQNLLCWHLTCDL